MAISDQMAEFIASEMEEVPKLLEKVIYGSKGGKLGSMIRCYVALNYLKEFSLEMESQMGKRSVDTAKKIASCMTFKANIKDNE